jgi:hypothetical protein
MKSFLVVTGPRRAAPPPFPPLPLSAHWCKEATVAFCLPLLNRPLNSARRLPRSPLKPVARLAQLVIQPLIRIYRDTVVVTHSR